MDGARGRRTHPVRPGTGGQPRRADGGHAQGAIAGGAHPLLAVQLVQGACSPRCTRSCALGQWEKFEEDQAPAHQAGVFVNHRHIRYLDEWFHVMVYLRSLATPQEIKQVTPRCFGVSLFSPNSGAWRQLAHVDLCKMAEGVHCYGHVCGHFSFLVRDACYHEYDMTQVRGSCAKP